MKFAYQTGPWIEDFASAWMQVAETGYSAIDTYCLSQWFGKPEVLKERLDELSLTLAAMECGGEWVVPERAEVEKDSMERAISFLAAMGGDALIMSGGRRLPEGTPLNDFEILASLVDDLGKQCVDHGLILCFHPKPGTLIDYRDQIDLLMRETDTESVYLCLDTGDLARSGSDPREVLQTYGSRIGHVHLKDLDWHTHRPAPPGQGSLQLHLFLEELKRSGYVRWVTVELEPSSQPSEDARSVIEYLIQLGYGMESRSP